MHNGDALKKYALMAYMDSELSEPDRAAFEEALHENGFAVSIGIE